MILENTATLSLKNIFFDYNEETIYTIIKKLWQKRKKTLAGYTKTKIRQV